MGLWGRLPVVVSKVGVNAESLTQNLQDIQGNKLLSLLHWTNPPLSLAV